MSYLRRPLAGVMLLSSVLLTAPSMGQTLMLTGPDGKIQVEQQSLGQYGPTQRNDTLWRIANEVRPDRGVTVYQVMQALFEANPHAFASDNFNSLERNHMLTIPTRDVILSYPANEAKTSAKNHDNSWQPTPKPARVLPPVQPAAKPVTDSQELKQLREDNQRLAQELDNQKEAVLQLHNLRAELDANAEEMAQMVQQNALLQRQMEQLSEELSLLRSALDEQQSLNRALEQELDKQRFSQAEVAKTGTVIDEPVEEPQPSGFWQSLSDNTLMLVMIGAIPVLLVIAGLLIWNSRRHKPTFKNPIQDGEMIAPLGPSPDPLTQMVPPQPTSAAPAAGAAAAAAGTAAMMSTPSSSDGAIDLGIQLDAQAPQEDSMSLEQLFQDEELTSATPQTSFESNFDAALDDVASSAVDAGPEPIDLEAMEPTVLPEPQSNFDAELESQADFTPEPAAPVADSGFGSDGFIDIDKLLAESEDAPSFDGNSESDSIAPAADLSGDDGGYNAKLDLARAYIEIEDVDSAKALLSEVVDEGSDAQQAEAKQLLAQLS